MNSIKRLIKKNYINNFRFPKKYSIKNNLNNKYESLIFLKIKKNNLNSLFYKKNFNINYITDKVTRINYVNFKNNIYFYNKKNEFFYYKNIFELKKTEKLFQNNFLYLHQLHQEIFFNSFIATLNYSAISRFIELNYTKNIAEFSLYPQWYNCVLSCEKNMQEFITDTMLAETNLFLTYKKYNILSQNYNYQSLEIYNFKNHIYARKPCIYNNDFTIQGFIRVPDTVLLYFMTKYLNY